MGGGGTPYIYIIVLVYLYIHLFSTTWQHVTPCRKRQRWFRRNPCPGQCSGLGIYYFADGSQYRGAWSHGKYDGEGLLYLANGDRERMTYLNGRLMKREVLTPSPPPQVGNKTKPGIFCGIHLSQDRVDMMMPTVRPQNHGDVQLLIKRDCDMYDLSAPPIRLPGQRSASEKMADDLLGTSIDTVTGGDTVGDYSSVLTSGPSTDEPTFLTGS
ncbi:PIP5K6 [Symbiodinium necroappetens]|uniref:PIP5K6 protein n=1 Tax=Symbiodinium necroappetens TaxID=1628268 RepID=A0A812LLC8_9DINO|nr:PIP5K6 [Symbiodinium necroappetens]